MSKFLFLYKGFVPPTPQIGQAWMDWFQAVGDRFVDSGNPIGAGVEVTPGGVEQLPTGTEALTGYSIVSVDDMEAAIELAKTNPMITSVVVHELGRM